jgi:co-chaperonin GroES (HSP10)
MKFQPMGNNLLVKIQELDKKTSSGLILVDETQSNIAWVVETGPNVLDVVQGDYVRLESFGTEVELDGNTYQIISEDSISGIYAFGN